MSDLIDRIDKRVRYATLPKPQASLLLDAKAEIERLTDRLAKAEGALKYAADALDIVTDMCPDVQIDPPKEWALETSEDASDGWCSTRALARHLRSLETTPLREGRM